MKVKIISALSIFTGMLCLFFIDQWVLNLISFFLISAGIVGLIKYRNEHKNQFYLKDKKVLENLNKNYDTYAEIEFPIKGMYNTNAKKLLDEHSITLGTRLEVKPEPDNRHDKNAMIVSYNSEKIGYVDKESALQVKHLYTKGYKICYVDKIMNYENDYFVLVQMPFM
ncbi:HIRAN domain-containing protein [Flavobacterium sp. I3-2]|uniref:HIRAN domain-containing protein n=1 Tax=Flavobacterium sp. I3-2 TaxID=2748319 RepID=UPI0015AC677F|nr:HIRAN domain-containing protein [Flavobacterium sp. I3-2]